MEDYAADKGRIYEGVERACVYNVADPVTEELVARGRRRRGRPGDRLHAGRPRRRRCSASSTTCSPTGPSSSSGRPAPPSCARSPTSRPRPRTSWPTPWPPRRWPARTASRRRRSATALRAFRPDGHRIADVAVVHGVTYVDDSKATNPHAAASLAAGLRARRVGRRRPRQGRLLRRPGRHGRASGCAAWCCSGADRAVIARGARADTRPMSP